MERMMAIDTQMAVVQTSNKTRATNSSRRCCRYARRGAIKTSSLTTKFLALQFWLSSASLLYLIATLISNKGANCARLPDIYWNSSNPIFRIDNTDHIFDVNRKQHDHDQVDLVCPNQPQTGSHNQSSAGSDRDERYIIYSVSKEEYDTCRLTSESPRVVAVCDQPAAGKPSRPPFTVTFRSFTPQPNGLEFKPGLDYYFITASLSATPSDTQRRFAPCREQNMRVIFKICCKSPNAGSGSTTNTPLQSLANRLLSMPANNPSVGATSGGSAVTSSPKRPTGQHASSFVTIRPSLAPSAGARGSPGEQQQPTNNLKTFEEFFGNAPSSSAQTAASTKSQHQSQPEPITVLPIEVLQPQQQTQSADSQPTSQVNSNQIMQDEQERNDILPNDQQQPGAPMAANHVRLGTSPSPFLGGGLHLGRSNGNQQQQQFLPFDPKAPPHIIKNYERYTPTPLPVHYQHQQHHTAASLPSSSSSSSSSRHRWWPSAGDSSNSWQLPPLQRPPVASLQQNQQPPPPAHHLQPQVRNAPSYSTGSNPRLSLYPWHNSYDSNLSNSAGLITASQTSAAASSVIRHAHQLTCLLALTGSALVLYFSANRKR